MAFRNPEWKDKRVVLVCLRAYGQLERIDRWDRLSRGPDNDERDRGAGEDPPFLELGEGASWR